MQEPSTDLKAIQREERVMRQMEEDHLVQSMLPGKNRAERRKILSRLKRAVKKGKKK